MSFGTLIVSYPDGRQETVELLKPTVDVGSADDNDIVLHDPAVNPYHAQLLCDSSGCQVLDLGSSTGTLLSGVELNPQAPETLVDHATIQMGGVRLRFRTTVDAPEPPPPVVEEPARRSALPALLATAAIILLALALGGLFLSGRLSGGDPLATAATAVETAAPVILPTVTPSAASTTTATTVATETTAAPEGAPQTAPPVQNYVVSTTGGLRLNVRSSPGQEAPVVGQLDNGTAVRGVDGPESAGGVEWVRIEAGGLSGWVVLEALLPQ